MSLSKLALACTCACLSLAATSGVALAAPPAVAASAAPSTGGKPLGITLPVLGTKSHVRLEYSGPIAPWKVMNPFHQGERSTTVALRGGDQSTRALTFRSDLDASARTGGV